MQDGIARVRANSVPKKGTTTYDVSHLCHYRGCANPQHLVVENHDDNQERNSCQGKVRYKVQTPEGWASINPCPHRATTRIKKECILPEVTIIGAGYLEGLPAGQLGAGQ